MISDKCFTSVWITEQRDKGFCIISGFQSQIEKDVLHYLLQGKKPIIIVLSRGLKRDEVSTYGVGLLYLLPLYRSQGLGKKMLALLEEFAVKELNAEHLNLRVRDYNLPAYHCYRNSGYKETNREGTAILMMKDICDT